jgi:hypothetical protein
MFFKVAIVITIILVLISFIKYCPEIDGEYVSYEEIRPTFKTGDVLITHGCNLLKSNIIRSCEWCAGTHVAMLIKIDGEFNVIDVDFRGFTLSRGTDARLTKLSDYIENHDHDMFAIIPIDEEITITEEELDRYLQFKYNTWIHQMFTPYENHRMCSNFVAMILKEHGVQLPMSEKSIKITPCDFYNSPKRIFFKKQTIKV